MNERLALGVGVAVLSTLLGCGSEADESPVAVRQDSLVHLLEGPVIGPGRPSYEVNNETAVAVNWLPQQPTVVVAYNHNTNDPANPYVAAQGWGVYTGSAFAAHTVDSLPNVPLNEWGYTIAQWGGDPDVAWTGFNSGIGFAMTGMVLPRGGAGTPFPCTTGCSYDIALWTLSPTGQPLSSSYFVDTPQSSGADAPVIAIDPVAHRGAAMWKTVADGYGGNGKSFFRAINMALSPPFESDAIQLPVDANAISVGIGGGAHDSDPVLTVFEAYALQGAPVGTGCASTARVEWDLTWFTDVAPYGDIKRSPIAVDSWFPVNCVANGTQIPTYRPVFAYDYVTGDCYVAMMVSGTSVGSPSPSTQVRLWRLSNATGLWSNITPQQLAQAGHDEWGVGLQVFTTCTGGTWPACSSSSLAQVALTWHDTRLSADNQHAAEFIATSMNNGSTWAIDVFNHTAGTIPWSLAPASVRATAWGDYEGIGSDPTRGVFWPAWGDRRQMLNTQVWFGEVKP